MSISKTRLPNFDLVYSLKKSLKFDVYSVGSDHMPFSMAFDMDLLCKATLYEMISIMNTELNDLVIIIRLRESEVSVE